MPKVLLWSDLHCHMHKSQFSRLNDCLKVIDWVFSTAIDRNIKTIIFAGDLFQDRQKIHVISYDYAFRKINDYCFKNQDVKFFMLVGNHDMWYSDKWDVSSISPLDAIPNVKVINSPCSIQVTDDSKDIFDFLPYTQNPIEDIQKHFLVKNDILISHCSVDGAQLNKVYNTKAEVSVEFEGDMVKVNTKVFDDWKRIFLGHYHCAQKLNDKVEYIGSPLELNFGEAHQEKHIIVFDTDTLETEYVINDFSPKHLIIKESDVDQYDLKNNFVQIIVDDITSTNILDLKKSLKDKKYSTIEFRERSKKEEQPLTEAEKKEIKDKLDLSSGDILERWVKAKGHDGLEFDKLLTIGQDIIRRT